MGFGLEDRDSRVTRKATIFRITLKPNGPDLPQHLTQPDVKDTDLGSQVVSLIKQGLSINSEAPPQVIAASSVLRGSGIQMPGAKATTETRTPYV